MKKSKKLLLAGVAAMGLVGIAAGTVSTFAWYSASTSAAAGNGVATGALTVEDKSQTLGSITIDISVNSTQFAANDQLVLTNRTGRTYYKSGNHYEQILATDFDTGDGHKQGTCTFNVSIKKTGSDAAHVTQDLLAGSAGTYYVKVLADGMLKLSLTKTAALVTASGGSTATTDDASKVNFAAADNMAYGALGKDADQYVDVMKIVISDAGLVTYDTVSSVSATEKVTWTENTEGNWDLATIQAGTAKATSAVFYGLEVNSDAARTSAQNNSDYALEANQAKMIPSLETSESHTA